eukprot:CAMPEP_0206399832 /NCGR_PEP_ID=MMETSP0294-20121207/25105_1 /ASSEMBLY_ACC=CAM_ASM_000327 /TAXON_ID=39354 /ORGANISM="Heterosigma akashiwo, Strain CCMP2393" /LENGTH=98 /DNA_ID=CAMNT_0053855809 /DNA_START=140 /DNA_END=436 /DNA_ORIENTATION=-
MVLTYAIWEPFALHILSSVLNVALLWYFYFEEKKSTCRFLLGITVADAAAAATANDASNNNSIVVSRGSSYGKMPKTKIKDEDDGSSSNKNTAANAMK